MPRVDDLPEGLAWLVSCNAFVVGSSVQYEDNLMRLADELQRDVVPLRELRDQIWSLYEQSHHEELLRRVDAAWADHRSSPSAGLAECCRLAAISATRSGDLTNRALWWARAVSSAHLSGATNVLAAGLLQHFFQISAEGSHKQARQVLDEVRRLLLEDAPDLPPRSMLQRLYHEKMAFSLYPDREYEPALVEYADAQRHTVGDARGSLKIRGARALCLFRLGATGEAENETRTVLRAATAAAYTDVRSAARSNLQVIRSGAGELVPYELL